MRYCALYNPKSGGKGCGKEPAKKLAQVLSDDEIYFRSMPEIKDFQKFFDEVVEDVVVCGGDGTLNYFINKVHKLKFNNQLWYFPTGSGNDFCADLNKPPQMPFKIDQYLKRLPILKVANKELVVINGAGAGIDGYVCAEGEKLRRAGRKTINYTMVGMKGLTKCFSPQKITLEIDGKKIEYDNVWFSPVMIGRYFGGGMMVAPMQERLKCKKLAVIVATCKSRIKVMSIFPKIFTGQHVKHTKNVKVLYGNHIKITLDKPTPLQYDGEVIPNVLEYEVIFD